MCRLNFFFHLNELSWKTYYTCLGFILTFITAYSHSIQLINLLSKPLLPFLLNDNSDLIFGNIFDVFEISIIVAFYGTIFFYTPLTLFFIFNFAKPGLFVYEKLLFKWVFKVYIWVLFISFIFTYFIIVPGILTFFLTLDKTLNPEFMLLKMQPKIFDYILFVCEIISFYCFVFCGWFLTIIVLSCFKFFNYMPIIKKRKLIIVCSLFFGCIFSPPEFINLFFSSCPVIISFELVLFFLILKSQYQDLKRYKESCLNGKKQVC